MSDTWRKWQFIQDLCVVTIGPVMLYYLVRKVLNRQEQGQDNPEITRRLEGILADRAQEQQDYELYSSDSGASYSDDSDDSDNYSDTNTSHSRKSRSHKHHGRRKKTLGTATTRIAPLDLTSYEQTIAQEVIHPSSIPVSFADIGGLDSIISDLQESVIYPLTIPSLYSNSASSRSTSTSTSTIQKPYSSLLTAPTGVLLYGPPGCGKTMLAKALAHESHAAFINLHISTLTNKWYGDSNKLVAAVFSLARKLAPAIVFVDEIDAVLGSRGRGGEHEASGMVKAEMMTHWDGLGSVGSDGQAQRIMVLGATNRIHDIDEAILRRMPKRFEVGLPGAAQRRRIFELVLRGTKIEQDDEEEHAGVVNNNHNKKDINSSAPPTDNPNPNANQTSRSKTNPTKSKQKAFDIDLLTRLSAGMSGSDIKEACREAAMAPMREFIQARKASGRSMRGVRARELRGLRTGDFAMVGRYHGVGEVDSDDGVEDGVEGEKGDWRDVVGDGSEDEGDEDEDGGGESRSKTGPRKTGSK